MCAELDAARAYDPSGIWRIQAPHKPDRLGPSGQHGTIEDD